MTRYRLNNIAKEDLLAIAHWGDEHHGVERSNQYRDDLKAHFVFLAENHCSIRRLSISGPGIVAVCVVCILSITGLTGTL